MNVILSIELQAFSENEIMDNLPVSVYNSIKAKDENPLFRAYVIGHTGTSKPRVIGEGSKEISWTKKAIQSLKSAFQKGIKFFRGHNQDNTTDNRESLGELVAVYEKEIDGILHSIGIGYFPKKDEVKDMNVCSIEADVNLIEQAGRYIADKIEKLTGIALGNSMQETPAFAGAKVIGEIQAFENTGLEKTMTFDEVKKAIKELNIFPHQIYSDSELKSDNVFGKVFSDYETLKKEHETKVGALEKEKSEITEKFGILQKEVLKTTANQRLSNYLKENNITMTEKEKKVVDSMFSKNEDYTDDGLKKFVENARSQYKELAKLGVIQDETVIIPHGKPNELSDELKDNPFINL